MRINALRRDTRVFHEGPIDASSREKRNFDDVSLFSMQKKKEREFIVASRHANVRRGTDE